MSATLVTEFDEQATALLKEHHYSVMYDIGEKKYRLATDKFRDLPVSVYPYLFNNVIAACEFLLPINPEFAKDYHKFLQSFRTQLLSGG